jgi:hypothetical protein
MNESVLSKLFLIVANFQVDIESFEARMLMGARKFMNRYAPTNVLIEIFPLTGIWTKRECNCTGFEAGAVCYF